MPDDEPDDEPDERRHQRRHQREADRRARTTRLSTVGIVWLAGLLAGFFGLLGAAARYGCGDADHGLACRGSGSALGVVLIVAVIAVVTAVTVLTYDRSPRDTVLIGTVGLGALAACFIAARMLLDTI